MSLDVAFRHNLLDALLGLVRQRASDSEKNVRYTIVRAFGRHHPAFVRSEPYDEADVWIRQMT
jgi:hypothetical protein